MQEQGNFYVTGGTLPPDSASYIPRAADAELLAALERGELCYVLNARQMGKSSLSVRVRQHLEAGGSRTAFLDLQKFGSSATAEQWYRALLERIGSDLKLRAQFLAYWRDNAELPPLARLFGALREVALTQIPGNMIVFLDEIDVVRDLSFKTDEFFGAIREAYNSRAGDSGFRRLTFCIIGTVAPTDLIRDVRLSPFNIGTRIKLADFTPAEAAPLAAPLAGGAKTLDRVLWWTSGHPYLTQRLCSELAKSTTGVADVDATVARLFFSKSDADVDENIKNVRNNVLRLGGEVAGFDRTDLLTRYSRIAAGKRVPDDDSDGVCTALRLSGIVTSVGRVLKVRCRVYARLFDIAWVRANLPDAELRRQRAAVARARWQVGFLAGLTLLIMSSLTLVSFRNAQRAHKNELLARTNALRAQTSADAADRLAYDANASLAQRAIEELHFGLAKIYIEDMNDLIARNHSLEAGFEMTYLEEQMHLARSELSFHKGAVNSVTFSNDGKYVLSGSSDNTARISNLADGKQLLDVTCPNIVTSVAFSPDRLRVAIAIRDGSVRVCNSATGADVHALAVGSGGAGLVEYSPDGRNILTVNSDRIIRIWAASTGEMKREIVNSQGSIVAAGFSFDGRKIQVATSDRKASIWDLATGVLLYQNKIESNASLIAFSPNGKLLLAARNAHAVLFDIHDGREVRQFGPCSDKISSAVFSQDGSRIATATRDNAVQVWESATGKQIRNLCGHSGKVTSIAFSRDGNLVATSSADTTIRVWDVMTDRSRLRLVGHSGAVNSLAFSPDGRRIVTGSEDHTARVWDAELGRQLLDVVEKNTNVGVTSVAFSPDGRQILTGCSDCAARLWDSYSGALVGHLQVGKHYFDFIENGGRAGLPIHQRRLQMLALVAYSPDGRRILTVREDGTVEIWHGLDSSRPLEINAPKTVCAAFSPDGSRIVTGSWDNSVCVWDAFTGQELAVAGGRTGGIYAISFSPDGKRVLTGSNNETAQLWDANAGAAILPLRGNSKKVNAVAFSPDGRRIVTGGNDGTTRLWDAITGRELLRITRATGWPSADAFSEDYVSAVVFSPNGKKLLTGHGDGIARVWNRMSNVQIDEQQKGSGRNLVTRNVSSEQRIQ